MNNKKQINKISIFLAIIVILATIWILFISRQNKKSIFDSSIILPSPKPPVYISPTPYPDIGRKCSDGNQCASSWCVDWKCFGEGIPVGSFQYPAKIVINNKVFSVSAYDYSPDTIYIGRDGDSSEFRLLKNRLCPSSRFGNQIGSRVCF